PPVSADFSQVAIDDRKVVRYELERAAMSRGLALVDLPDAANVGIQRAAGGLAAIPLPEPLIFSGQVSHPTGGDRIKITLSISYKGQKLHEWTSDPTALTD